MATAQQFSLRRRVRRGGFTREELLSFLYRLAPGSIVHLSAQEWTGGTGKILMPQTFRIPTALFSTQDGSEAFIEFFADQSDDENFRESVRDGTWFGTGELLSFDRELERLDFNEAKTASSLAADDIEKDLRREQRRDRREQRRRDKMLREQDFR